MTKEQMIREMINLYDHNLHAFKEIKVDRINYLLWLESLPDHEWLQRAYRYVFRDMLKRVAVMNKILEFFKPATWEVKKKICKSEKEVKMLFEEQKSFRIVWRARPHPPKKRVSE